MKPRTYIFIGLALLLAYLYSKRTQSAQPANVNAPGAPAGAVNADMGGANFGAIDPSTWD